MAQARFYETLTAAVNDLVEHGFDSQQRLEGWLDRLRQSAVGALVPEAVLVRALRDALTRTYERAISPRELLKAHRDIPLFTVERIKPSLRAELDRRILASANLITLNRQASIQRTLQRFAGWASSIPAGGTDIAKRADTKNAIRRGIAGLPFEERRVITDQGHKLVAAIHDIVARDGGAIAGKWRHVAEGPPAYDARPEHVALNGKVLLIRGSWAHKDGLAKPGKAGYTDEIEAPAELVFCGCQYQFLYTLGALPTDMLTARGKLALERARHAA